MIPTHRTPSHPSHPSQPTHIAQSSRYRSLPNITDFTVSIPGTARLASGTSDPGPPRWRTREFMVYGVMFVVVVPMLVYQPIKLSSPTHPNYPRYAYRLSPGWLFGRQVDNSDPQYHSFRSNLAALLVLSSSYLALSTLTSHLAPSPRSRATFLVIFSTIMLLVFHGVSTLKILLILYLNYHLATTPKSTMISKMWPGILIVGNMVILFLNHRYEGYKFSSLQSTFDLIDQWDGLLPRWHINFNITMLRIVSFALDYHWKDTTAISTVTTPPTPPTEYRIRVTTRVSVEQYSLVNYIAYCLYPPLYIAGPIITFNDFIWQMNHPLAIPLREKVSYFIRFLFCLLTMESVLHTMYVVAIKDSMAWEGDGPADLSMIGFWNLVVVWLKLLIPWRFFRLWALLDGLDPPENMVRCVANNYSTLGFWRSWHRSYNLWLLRYLYIPMGGSKNVVLATIVVFTFVALWHDLSFNLLAWGWLVCLFILPELLARRVVSAEKYGHLPWYRHVSALGGVFNILMMMSANLIGFVLGLDGMKHLINQLINTVDGWKFTLFACICLYATVQVMFEYREEERRKGVERKC